MKQWFNVNKPSLNCSKTSVMIFSNRQTHKPKLEIDGTKIDRMKKVKFLDIIIDEDGITLKSISILSKQK